MSISRSRSSFAFSSSSAFFRGSKRSEARIGVAGSRISSVFRFVDFGVFGIFESVFVFVVDFDETVVDMLDDELREEFMRGGLLLRLLLLLLECLLDLLLRCLGVSLLCDFGDDFGR